MEISLLQKKMMMYRVEVLPKVKEVWSSEQYEQFRSRVRAQMEGKAHRGGKYKKGKNAMASTQINLMAMMVR